jgi:tetratricopeptide (TPR) repeat protein
MASGLHTYMHDEFDNAMRRQIDELLASGKSSEALGVALQAIQLTSVEQDGNVTMDRAAALDGLGRVHFARAEYESAVSPYREAAEIVSRLCGPASYQYSIQLGTLADVYRWAGKLSLAFDAAQESLKILDQSGYRFTPGYFNALSRTAENYQLEHRFDEAVKLALRSLKLRVLLCGKDSRAFVWGLLHVAIIYIHLDRWCQAGRILRRALHLHNQVGLSDEGLRASTLEHLGIVLRHDKEYAAARQMFQQAFELLNRVDGEQHPDTRRVYRRIKELGD